MRLRRPHTPLPQPDNEDERESLAWRELERSFQYFHVGAGGNRLVYITLRVVVLVSGALVPIMALTSASSIIVAVLGALVVVAEGVAQLTQVHDHWIRYRRTAESLRREALAFCTGTGAYQTTSDLRRDQQLAARMLDVVGQENSAWEETVRSGIEAGGGAPRPNS